MKSRKHLVSRVLFTMLATDESNGVALSPSPGSISQSQGQPTRTGLGPNILHSHNERGPFPLGEEEPDQSLEDGEEYEDELEEDPDDLLDKHIKLLDSDVIPYHKKPGFCTSSHGFVILHLNSTPFLDHQLKHPHIRLVIKFNLCGNWAKHLVLSINYPRAPLFSGVQPWTDGVNHSTPRTGGNTLGWRRRNVCMDDVYDQEETLFFNFARK